MAPQTSSPSPRLREGSPRGALRGSVIVPAIGLAVLGLTLACTDSIQEQVSEARAQLSGGQVALALGMLTEVVAERPDHKEAHYLLGVSQLRAGQPGLAVGPLAKASTSEEFGVPAGVALASALLGSGDAMGAHAAASRVLEQAPDQTAALHTRARASLATGRPAEALADAEALLALDASALHGFQLRALALTALGRLDEAEAAHRRALEVTGDHPALGPVACLGLAAFQARQRGHVERARETFAGCLAAHPTDLRVLRATAEFSPDAERALAPWREAVAREPGNLALQAGLAEQLDARGRTDEAATRMRQAAEASDQPAAWLLLANHRLRHGHQAEALDALARAQVHAVGEDADKLRVLVSEIRIADGDLEAAEAALEEIQLPERRDQLKGLLAAARGNPAEALAAFERALERATLDASLHFAAGRAARDAGDWERAARHLAAAVQLDAGTTGAALLLAELQLETGAYAAATALAARQAALGGVEAPRALLLQARAELATGNAEGARNLVAQAERSGAAPAALAVERARLARREGGAPAAAGVLLASGLEWTDPASEDALRFLADDLLQLGRAEEAQQLIDETVAARPERGALREIQGRVRFNRGEVAAARQAFEGALARDRRDANALRGLAEIAVAEGRRDEAVALLERAAIARPSDGTASYRAAQILLAQGRVDAAEAQLRAALKRSPGNAFACNDLAWLLAEEGRDLELALELARRATRLRPEPNTFDTLGWTLMAAQQPHAAAVSFRRAVSQRPDAAVFWYHLGLAQAQIGDEGEAVVSLRKALSLDDFEQAESARSLLESLDRG